MHSQGKWTGDFESSTRVLLEHTQAFLVTGPKSNSISLGYTRGLELAVQTDSAGCSWAGIWGVGAAGFVSR